MAASSNLIGDISTVITNGPSAATQAKSIAAAGPIMDYNGNCNGLLTKFKETSALVTLIKTDTDSSDAANLALLNKLLAALNGTSTPSTTLITDIQSVISTGPAVATQSKAIAAAGPIMDYNANCFLVKRKLQESYVLATAIGQATDSGDSNLTAINNIRTALS